MEGAPISTLRAFLLKSYRARQRYFELGELVKRVAHDRLHQHARGVVENIYAQLSAVLKCMAPQRNFSLIE